MQNLCSGGRVVNVVQPYERVSEEGRELPAQVTQILAQEERIAGIAK